MSSRKSVLSKQSEWAAKAGLSLTPSGYLPSWQENLHRPLSMEALRSFRSGSGNELQDSEGRAAKMRAAHSSSALVVNVFDYWSERPGRVLSAFGLDGDAEAISFEAQLPTGLAGNPPNLDMCIRRTGGRLVGVESKFTEWLSPKSASKEHFKPKYFPVDGELWAGLGLRASQRLAEDVHARAKRFRFLDAPQLLKHVLGLAKTGSDFELCYLYFDIAGPEAATHRAEIREFSQAVDGDFVFHVSTYQEVFSRIRASAAEADAAYVAYLNSRYFA